MDFLCGTRHFFSHAGVAGYFKSSQYCKTHDKICLNCANGNRFHLSRGLINLTFCD